MQAGARASAKASAAKEAPAVRKVEPASMLIALSVSKTPEGSGPVSFLVTGAEAGGQQIGAPDTNFNRDLSGFAAHPEGPMNARV
jgi:hypothetical protein